MIDSTGKSFIYVLGPDKKVYTGEYNRGTFNHSSFLSGSPVMGAGELVVKDGKIVEITDKSGHYEPDDSANLRGLRRFI